mmetsp:Transcript_19772/g.24964  ORF Transcript_19772/g.24964 Transcript_19772/m.24964 type:complete len:84 (+) Transcript_19772:78-329(+)
MMQIACRSLSRITPPVKFSIMNSPSLEGLTGNRGSLSGFIMQNSWPNMMLAQQKRLVFNENHGHNLPNGLNESFQKQQKIGTQ